MWRPNARKAVMRFARLTVLATLALALLATPLPAAAQPPPGKVYKVGWLHPLQIPPDWEEGFRQGLREFGYVEGRDLVIERQWGGGVGRLPAMAAPLVQLNVDVIIAGNSAAVQALKDATKTIPIVMTATNNPVATGYIASLARPGGNITGLSGLGDLGPKRLELLKEVLPRLARVTMLSNLDNPSMCSRSRRRKRPQRRSALTFTTWTCETSAGSIRLSPPSCRPGLTALSCRRRPSCTARKPAPVLRGLQSSTAFGRSARGESSPRLAG